MEVPEFSGFTRLQSLYLSMVKFLDSMLLGTFVSGCPVLESLTMHNCKFHDFKILDIAAPRLKNLTINALASANAGLFNCEVIVACPSLVSFNLLGTPSSLSFPGTNSLQNVYIFFNHGPEHRTVEECHHLMDSILRGICNIKVLKLSAAFLGSVRLLDFRGSENELELVRFLLKKGVVLETLSITWLRGVENRWEIILEIKKFPTSSSNVAFTFFKPGSNIYSMRDLDHDHDL
ncbi:hypothetical protein EZV62_009162 [Acer yangbiense]|uniref:FBD domain-containing protein n=1 Tax=Acer yangbiense TaxID=1000413 RepID=A0A5C7IEW4_9ROSI|nr:hypothetical protein EZV62_009162 [Acer yangbiense]